MSILSIQWTLHTMRTAIEDVGVDLRRLDVTMPKQRLHGTNAVACLQQMGFKAVAQV